MEVFPKKSITIIDFFGDHSPTKSQKYNPIAVLTKKKVTVHGSTFRIKDKERIEVTKSSSKMLISPGNF